MQNWCHLRCVHFMSKLLVYKQLRLSYSKLSVLIFATFQFFMFWFKTDFVKWKFQFRNSLFDLKWKNESQKISFISQIWLTHWKRKNEKKIFWLYFDLTLSWRRPLPHRNQSIDLFCKSVDWFLHDNGPRQERVKTNFKKQKSKFWNSFFDFKSKNEFQKVLSFFNFCYQI